ncbi:inositol monophosphatase 2 [Magnaporthiopsis poae ATCC 64411]|uniref:Inositol monophosphatase 2 n=1 Tax=Magnaporthiopsis poae (strain ATCC 64411 / 73-15) TaxID=644358 RepID=A0A0C4DY48_MAGP6|nr:inositol monophosphatase 2 [Magnaporthiopsis poae ATCC 64411]
MSALNLQQIHDTLVAIAFEAGRMVREAKPESKTADTKMNSVDMVTETDKAVEKLVMTRLQAAYPTFDFVGEESYQRGTTSITDRPTFVVDPIDGTTNFIHGFPAVCVSLGFVVDKQPAAGVVYNPFADVLFTGIKGGGAYMQRRFYPPINRNLGLRVNVLIRR